MTPSSTARRRTPLAATALAALTSTVVAGCSLGGPDVRGGSESYQIKGAGSRVRTLDLTSHDGDVTVTAADPKRTTVGVIEDFAYEKTKPRTEHSVNGGTLHLTADTCGGNDGMCVVNYTVSVPAAMSVRLKTGSGDIVVRATSGSVRAEAGGGDVRMIASRARQVRVKTGAGSLFGAFAAPPSKLSYKSGGGNVTLRLPKGEYAVDATTGGGDRKVAVPTAPSSPHEIRARSGGGDVSVLRAGSKS
ncbi:MULTISPECIES: DUF4097 family beta strand repeat-containing protein [unclassified Streptomyces]|uniref:DUF4097 family beta strand repeat-containing protein n=1 Tax=unclassified Streptomyces TaxID=2593676 RepID=UPI002DDB25B4|nr:MULTISPECIES: DUF4097 family beta strand repeat-containing protein [unclassified Streptomyces]WSA91584.1 DUF4097 domain-containing protein [Streptomyces sp. NBC_01795]WSB75954.1 DUF4097 domain-containing protein [Streptomyces sp. NBC_01775]WSS15770.1 DUF4097 domain-containing protein [Streptomyces sp. NBC_01186]WSS44609.1 DUF4097 domain-containing protein [Streptomyces sp. NBC_01187]